MTTTLLLLLAMETLSLSARSTSLPVATTEGIVNNEVLERNDEKTDQAAKEKPGDSTDKTRRSGLTAIFISGEEIDINHLGEEKINHLASIVEALEELDILEKSRGTCYSLARILRHKATGNKWLVDISFVINTHNSVDKSSKRSKDLGYSDGCVSKNAIAGDANVTLNNVSYSGDVNDDLIASPSNVSLGQAISSIDEQEDMDTRGLSRTQLTVIVTCSVVIGVFFSVAVVLRVRNHIKRKKESEAIARRPTFRSCSVSLRSQNENSSSRHALKDDEANMSMIDKDEDDRPDSPVNHKPVKSPVNHNHYQPLVNSAPSPRSNDHFAFSNEKKRPDDFQTVPLTSPLHTFAPDLVIEDYTISRQGAKAVSKPMAPSRGQAVTPDGPPEIPPRVPLRAPPRLTPLRKAPEPVQSERLLTNTPPSGQGTPRPSRLDMSHTQVNSPKKKCEVILQPSETMNMRPAVSPPNSLSSSLGSLSFGNKKNYQRLENYLPTPDCESCAISPLSSSVLSPGETVSTEVETPVTIDNSPQEMITSPSVPVSFQNPAYSIITSPEASNGVVTNGTARGLMRHFREYLRGSNMHEMDDISPCSPCSDLKSQSTLDDRSIRSTSFVDASDAKSVDSTINSIGSSSCSPLHIAKVPISAKQSGEERREIYKDHMSEANGLDDNDSSEENASTSLLSHRSAREKDSGCSESSFLLGPEFEGMEPTYV